MSTMRVKNKDGTWDKVPVLGSYQAVLAANEAATNAQNAANAANFSAEKAEDVIKLMKSVYAVTDIHLSFIGRKKRDTYKSAQGMCVRVINNRPYIYTCYFNYNLNNPQSIIEAIDFDGNVYATSQPLPIGHANGICYNEKQNVFVVTCDSDLAIINADTLSILQRISMSFSGIAYNADENCYYGWTGTEVYKCSADLDEKTKVMELTFDNAKQTITYYNNTLYFIINNPNFIIAVDIETWSVRKIYKLDYFADGYYPIGEIQEMYVYNTDGDFIVNGKPRGFNPDTESYDDVGDGITVFAKGNIVRNMVVNNYNDQIAVLNAYKTVEVNSNANSFKPIGTEANPFVYLADIMLCLDAPLFKPNRVNLVGNFETENLVINQRFCANINGINDTTVKGIVFFNSTGQLAHITALNKIHIVRSIVCCIGLTSLSEDEDAIFIETGSIVLGDYLTSPYINSGYSKIQSAIFVDLYNNWYEAYNGVGSSQSYEATVNLTRNLKSCREIMFVVKRASNNRIVATNVLPIEQFTNSAVYFNGIASINGSIKFTGIFIYNTDTSLTIASQSPTTEEDLKYQVFVR